MHWPAYYITHTPRQLERSQAAQEFNWNAARFDLDEVRQTERADCATAVAGYDEAVSAARAAGWEWE